ncbi:hypothetical protein CYY_010056 [Polysphondylium violaceum]|uniref:HTH La-type RNA-binding domain-containing protein n=1 Tax=Polysphondylium violaceum TaxID=133409 RepID=A0A8J4PK45_9MYCE|nr:hypothetical protein CYY_010056 [Polysphondylium violaceum]
MITVDEPTTITEQLPLEDQIRNQIDYYLSRQNLSKDYYLTQRMNNEMFVPLEVIANFKKVKNLTTDINLIIEVMSKSTNVILDENKTHIKPAFKLQRNIIILRDILSETPVDEIKAIFASTNKNIVNLRSEIGNNWFITFENEQDALEAHDIVIKQTFKDKQIKARIKTESLIKNPIPTTTTTTPTRPPYTPYQPNNTHRSSYYNNNNSNQTQGGKPWNRTGGYPYGGWDQQQQGTHQQYDPSKSTGERKPFRGGLNKDGTPRAPRQNRGENTQFVNKDTTATTNTTEENKTTDSSKRLGGRKHSSSNKHSTTSSPSSSSSSSSPSPSSPVHTSANASTTTAPVSSTETTTTTSTTSPTERKSTSQHKTRKPKKLSGSPSDEPKETKPVVPQTPPGPQHFPPLNGDSNSTPSSAPVENKKKEWGPADKKMTIPTPQVVAVNNSESTPAVVVASTTAPATSSTPTPATAASSSSPAKSSKKSASSSSSQPKKSPSKNADDKKKSAAATSDKKKPAAATTTAADNKPVAAAVASPVSEAEKKVDSQTPDLNGNEKKQPTYADIIAMNAAKAAAAANGTSTTEATTTPAAVEQQ